MKQIDECLDRAFSGKKPLKKKWRAFITQGVLFLYHYHHLVLVYDIDTDWIVKEWWEKQADKRGLEAAKAYLKQMQDPR